MFNEPITTIEQAKAFFRAMECSSYHMWREFPKRHDEYKSFNISKQTETEWQEERFEEYYTGIMSGAEGVELRNTHSRMYDLFDALKTEAALQKMLEVTQSLRDRLPMKDRAIVAETISGQAAAG